MAGREDLRSMQEAWRAYLDLALGLTETSRKRATKVAKKLVGRGGATADQLQTMVEDLLKTSMANREAMTRLIHFELDRALGKVGLATQDEVTELTSRVRELEQELATARAAAATPAPAPAPVVVQTAPPVKAVRKVVKKAAPPAAPEPAAVQKAVVKKAVAKKAVAKKAVAKKAVATKAGSDAATPVRKVAVKKAVAKKAVAKKTTPARKATGGVADDVVLGDE